ncbi:MAG: Crp/Fnr family transcriptional regulator [Pseudomonadota bacterium]
MGEIAEAWAKFCAADISTSGVQRLAAASRPRRLAPRAALMEQDQEGSQVYLVGKGRLKAVRYSEEGDEIWLAELSPGDLIGEMSALECHRRSSAVEAQDEALVFSISNTVFLAELQAEGPFSLAVARLLAKRVRDTSARFADTLAKNVEARLHQELLGLAKRADPAGAGPGLVLRPRPEILVLAKRIHATRESCSRALSALKEKRLVIVEGHGLRVFPARAGSIPS